MLGAVGIATVDLLVAEGRIIGVFGHLLAMSGKSARYGKLAARFGTD